jgi:superfamily II DNA or RNA helicase
VPRKQSLALPLFGGAALGDAKPPPTLRPYQSRAIVNIRAQIIYGRKRILCVGPTALGKTVIIAGIVRTSNVPCIFVAHRMEIVDQIVNQLGRVGLTNVGVLRGDDERFNPYASLQVCSIQTLARREKPFARLEPTPEKPFPQLIIIDEAHRAGSDSYVEHIFRAYPHAIILGFTATPTRLDNRPLGGELFEEIVQIATYEELLKNPEWLVAPEIFAAPYRSDTSLVPMSGSDFDEERLAQVVHTDRLEGQIVEHWFKWANSYPAEHNRRVEGECRRTLVFAVNILHSQSIATRFEKAGVKVAHLDGNTPESQRRAMLRDLACGALQIVCNCNVAVEGVDVEEIKCIVHARPTHSLTSWRQATGRCMRPWKGVKPILLDHAGNMDRLGCPFEDLHWSLTKKPARIHAKPALKMCGQCFAYVPAGKFLCPYCNYEFKPDDERGTPEETQAQLEARSTDPDALKRDFFNRQVLVAKTRGFKPGYASKLYRDKYGVWPPREWSDAVKVEFTGDAAWQLTMSKRLNRKAEREEREREEKAAMAAAPETGHLEEPAIAGLEETVAAIDAAEPEYAEAPFAEWLDQEGIE